jgi:hypothetical protein
MMVKTGTKRSNKFAAKHDPETILLRIKRLQNFSIDNFADAAQQAFFVDENVVQWLTENPLKYGQAGSLLDLVKELAWKWHLLTDAQKTLYHDLWVNKGLPEVIWLKIAQKNDEVLSLHRTQNSHNIMVTFEADCFPYPEEDMNPQELDYVENNEVLPLPIEPYAQNYWRQKTNKFGDVDYNCVWSAAKMDKTISVDLIIETVQPLLYEKTVTLDCFLTEPYQSPIDKTPSISTSYVLNDGIDKGKDKTSALETSSTNIQIQETDETPSINITFTTEVT